MFRNYSCVDEHIDQGKMGLSDTPSTALQVPGNHYRGRRASEGMLDLRRGTLPPLPTNKSSSIKSLNGSMSKLSVSPIVTLVVNDDEAMPSSSSPRLLTRRGSSPWSKTTSSSPSSPQSLLSVSHPVVAPSPPRTPSPGPFPSNVSQARHRRYRRGSLPTSTLNPTPSTDVKSGFTFVKENSHDGQSSNDTHAVDENSNIKCENSSTKLFSKTRTLSPYPHNYPLPVYRRRSDGAIQTNRNQSQEEKTSNNDRIRNTDIQNKTIASKVPIDGQRLRHRNSDSAVVVKVTRPQTRRPNQHHDPGFVPISKNEDVVGDDDDSTVCDFDDEMDDEARQWILNWLEGVEKSSEKTPAVALDDLCHYNTSRETAIKVFYEPNET